MKVRPRSAWLFLAAPVALYLAAACFQIDYPGLFVDEVYPGVGALQMAVPGIDFRMSEIDVGLRIFDRFFPLVHHPLHGALACYAALPFVAALGPTTFAVRCFSMTTALLVLVILFRFVRKHFDDETAFFATLLLAVHPSFVAGTRIAAFGPLSLLLTLAAVVLLTKSVAEKSLRFLYWGQFMLGLGMSAHGYLYYFILTVEAMLLGFWYFRAGRRPCPPGTALKTAALCVLCLAAGAGLLVAYNLVSDFGSYRFARRIASGEFMSYLRYTGDAPLLHNMGRRFLSLVELLNGHYFASHTAFQDNAAFVSYYRAGNFMLWLFGACYAALLLRLRSAKFAPRFMLPACGLPLYFLASSTWSSDFSSTHVFLALMPMLLVVAEGVRWLRLRADRIRRPLGTLAAAALLGGALAVQVFHVASYHAYLHASGGVGVYSHAQPELVDWLLRNGHRSPVLLDSWLESNLVYLSAGRIKPVRGGGRPYPGTLTMLQEKMKDPANVYLHLEPSLPRIDPGILREFNALLEEKGLVARKVREFYQKDGRPAVIAVKVEAKRAVRPN